MIHPSIKARVRNAIPNGRRMDDINKVLTVQAFSQILAIYEEIRNFHLDVEDNWTWLWDAKGEYTAKSVYIAHFAGSVFLDLVNAIRKSWAPLRCKVAAWLFITGRIWTADKLAKGGLPHNDKCVFCKTEDENVQHLFLGYAVISIIWGSILNCVVLSQVPHSTNLNLKAWWLHAKRIFRTRTRVNSIP
jgi:hypothetical protein